MPNWNQIVRANAANVLNAAFRLTGNLADAEDVSQEVFTEAYQKFRSTPNQSWAGILRRMSVCRSIDLLRSKKPVVDLSADLIDARSAGPLGEAIGIELEQRLRSAICDLSDRESQVFCLMYFERQSHEEICNTLAISPAAVATALSKARAKLARAFAISSKGERL